MTTKPPERVTLTPNGPAWPVDYILASVHERVVEEFRISRLEGATDQACVRRLTGEVKALRAQLAAVTERRGCGVPDCHCLSK
jgi:hypothetical protein